MKIELIIDSEGVVPDSDPPVIKIFPAGTIESGILCWIHCLPDQSGNYRDRNTGEWRAAPGIVRAVPADEECEQRLEAHLAKQAQARGVTLDFVKSELARLVAKSRASQKENENV